MSNATYTPLATRTLTGNTASVTFSNIPNTYKDLVLILSLTPLTAGSEIKVNYNGDTGTNYPTVRMYGSGSGSGASNTQNEAFIDIGYYDTNAVGVTILQIFDYSATDKHKTSLIRWNGNGGTANYVGANANRWANTAAINQIAVAPRSSSFTSGTVLSLYGILG